MVKCHWGDAGLDSVAEPLLHPRPSVAAPPPPVIRGQGRRFQAYTEHAASSIWLV